ncbi:MAG TPA: ribosome small subunit-dependent GTPase A [Flavobacteriales bacterium]|nr:ribosome small subunit-dependent GTPase A [Flavobacteriales bacterium]
MNGRVFKTTGSFYWIRDEKGEEYTCRLKGNIRLKNYKFTNPAAVGDLVEFTKTTTGEGTIDKILPRKNYIVRKSVNLSKQAHILASNVDQALMIATLAEPKTYPEFIDRFLVTAEAYHIPAVIVFNKRDIYEKSMLDEMNDLVSTYEKIGYRCLTVSALQDNDLNDLHDLMKGKTSLMTGYSGVGKSTLINKLDPGLKLATQNVSSQHRAGVHTTTYAEMHKLKDSGYVIDTPGIKGIGVLGIKREELSHYFLEMRALLPDCKFNNCVHIDEPHCAIKKALEEKKIAASRYKSYLNIYLEDDSEIYRG